MRDQSKEINGKSGLDVFPLYTAYFNNGHARQKQVVISYFENRARREPELKAFWLEYAQLYRSQLGGGKQKKSTFISDGQ